MKWDFTITVGDLLTAVTFCGTIAGFGVNILRRLDRLVEMHRQFPPHRHVGEHVRDIIYPVGMNPDLGERKS